MILTIQHGDLKDGMQVWNSGVLFEISNVRHYPMEGVMLTRYEGKVIGGDVSLKGTMYDGGTYGGRFDLAATIELDPFRFSTPCWLREKAVRHA